MDLKVVFQLICLVKWNEIKENGELGAIGTRSLFMTPELFRYIYPSIKFLLNSITWYSTNAKH